MLVLSGVCSLLFRAQVTEDDSRWKRVNDMSRFPLVVDGDKPDKRWSGGVRSPVRPPRPFPSFVNVSAQGVAVKWIARCLNRALLIQCLELADWPLNNKSPSCYGPIIHSGLPRVERLRTWYK